MTIKRAKRWTEEDLKYLIENYSHMTAKEISSHIGRNVWSIYNKVSALGLEKVKT